MSTLPDSVVIAGQAFAVTIVPRDELRGAHARIDGVTQRIRIADDQGPDATRECVLHEVLHGVRIMAALPRREREVNALSIQLLDTLRRNPQLVAYLMNARSPDR